LRQDWGSHRVFCNPPYGRGVGAWARKSFEASQQGALVVLLVHARTDTRWFHDWVHRKAAVTFLRGRLRFGIAESGAPFPSLLWRSIGPNRLPFAPGAARRSSAAATPSRAAAPAGKRSTGTAGALRLKRNNRASCKIFGRDVLETLYEVNRTRHI